MKKLLPLLWLLLMAVTLPAAAQRPVADLAKGSSNAPFLSAAKDQRSNIVTNPSISGNRMVTFPMKDTEPAEISAKKKPLRVAADGNLTLHFTPDTDTQFFGKLIIVNKENYYSTQDMGIWGLEEGQTTLTLSVEPGTYFVAAQFWNNPTDWDNEVVPTWIYSMKEDVAIGENTELYFSAQDACNTISFRSVLPNGKDAILPTLIIDRENDIYEWDDTNTTVGDICFSTNIYHEDYGILFSAFGNAGHQKANGLSGEIGFDFMTSDVSEKVIFLQGRMLVYPGEGEEYISPDACYTLTGVAGCNKDITVTNDANGYISFNGETAPAASYMPDDERPADFNSSVMFTFLIDEDQAGGYGTTLGMKSPATPVFLQESLAEKMNIRPRVEYGSVDVVIAYSYETPWGDIRTEYGTYGITNYPSVLVDGEWQTAYFGNCMTNYSFQKTEDGVAPEYPGNPAFLHANSEYDGIPGNNAPILEVMQQINSYGLGEDIRTWISHEPSYIGRVGEYRFVDLLYTGIEVYRDGELLETLTYEDLDRWQSVNAGDGHTPGVVEVKYTNNNILVDGMPGYNYATIRYDETADDRNIPTLQMLWFRNNDGTITDRFTKGSDGVIEFSGADFNWHDTDRAYWFEAGPVEISVEYAPHNTNEWAALEVTEVPENFYMPGYGYFWRGDLSQVKNPSADGWYDIRVAMEDATGNSQVQHFGPALFISSNVGVNGTAADTFRLWLDGNAVRVSADRCDVSIYTTDGRLLDSAILGNAAKGGITLPGKGAYVVKATDGRSTVTRKVIL